MHSPIQEIKEDLLSQKNIRLFIKREDRIHPYISGNKWRKLKYNLLQAKKEKYPTLLTYGGAYSNHISAVASCGKLFNFKTIGIIRGELVEPLNPTLQFAKTQGMHLHFVTRSAYKLKNDNKFREELQQLFGRFYEIPEGGTNKFALLGCIEMAQELEAQYAHSDYICVPCGTGGTMAGMIKGLKSKAILIGFSVLKGDFLSNQVKKIIASKNTLVTTKWEMNTNYHFGGYAKFDTKLIDFINQFKQRHHIPLDPIYTGKMMYGIFELIEKDYFPKNSTIVAIHTGGLQGIKGFNQRFGELIL